MNLVLLFPDDFVARDHVRLTGRRLQHVREVHRAQTGDALCVGLCQGDIGTGEVLRCDETALELRVRFTTPPPPALPVTLLLALPRPKVLKRILLTATAMGVKRIILLNSYRVEKSYWRSPLLDPTRLHEPLHLGLEQARDTVLPEVLLRPLFKPFVEDELPALADGHSALVAHPDGPTEASIGVTMPGLLAIGPEGGFIPYEIDKLLCAGFRPFSLGPRILRVEAAVPALLARLYP